MTTNYKHLKADADWPGVKTQVTQSIDLSTLDDAQLRRVVRAVERGHIARSGYVAGLVRACAKHLGVAAPITITVPTKSDYLWNQAATIHPLPKAKYEKPFADLMKLSQVRWELRKTQFSQPQLDQLRRYGPSDRFTSGWTGYDPATLQLYGWAGHGADLRPRIETVLRKAGYYKDLQKLADFIKSKPRFDL